MTRIALLRHGKTDWNRAHRIQGRTDRPLDVEGAAEMAALALPPPWDRAALLSSPLSRARRTAEILGTEILGTEIPETGRAAPVDPRLTEMDWGAWEGLRGADLCADPDSGWRDIEDWGWDWAPPGGESPARLRARIAPVLAKIAAPTLIISHIGVMRAILAQAHGWDFSGPAPFKVKRNRLYVIEIWPGGALAPVGAPLRLIPRAEG